MSKLQVTQKNRLIDGVGSDGNPSVTQKTNKELTELVNKYTYITSTKQLMSTTVEMTKPFSTGVSDTGDLIISVPKNIDALCETHYLFKLALLVYQKEGYNMTTTDVDYTTRLKPDGNVDLFLKGYGIAVTSDKLPEIPARKGIVRTGILTAWDVNLTHEKEFDHSLTKLKKCQSAAIHLFGDVWGRNYPTEKRLLDKITSYIRTLKTESDLSAISQAPEKIVKDKGLNLKLKSDLLTPAESDYLAAHCRKKNISTEVDSSKLVSKNMKEHIALKKFISDRQNAIKEIKNMIRDINSKRVVACYAPYKTGPSKKKAKATPIRELKECIKNTIHYDNFNSTEILRLDNLVPMPIIHSSEVKKHHRDTFEVSLQKLKQLDYDDPLIENLFSEFEKFTENVLKRDDRG